MKTVAGKFFPLFILLILLVLLTTISFLSDGYYAGADNISHYQISRYSYQHTFLFFSMWGRPLFTFLGSPFAQFGFYGIKMFNVIVALLTAWFTYKTARTLNYSSPWLVMILVIFSPLYFVMIFTGLTEPLFGLVLILAVYLFFKEKYIFSAIMISFIPFARMEGVILFPLFFLAFLLKKEWKAIPFMAFGFLLLSLIGLIYSGNYHWIIDNYPKSGNHPIYFKYSGPWYHFIRQYPVITGLPVTILLLIGLCYQFFKPFKGTKTERSSAFFQVLLIAGSVLAYLGFHSYLYWAGKGGSIGLVRVLVGVMPLAGIIALNGYQWLEKTFVTNRWQQYLFLAILVFTIIRLNFKTYDYPVELGIEETQVKRAADWIKDHGLDRNYFYATDANTWFFLDKDPYDKSTSNVINNSPPKTLKEKINDMDKGSLVIWDAHFGPNECQIPIDTLMKHPRLKLVYYTQPEQPWITFGDQKYEVYVFRVLASDDTTDNYSARDSISTARFSSMSLRKVEFKNYESLPPAGTSIRLSKDFAYSGSFSCLVDSATRFCSGISTEIGKVTSLKKDFFVVASAEVFPVVPFTENSTWLVITLDHYGNNYFYASLVLENEKLDTGKWNPVIFRAYIPEVKAGEDHFGVYLWHRGVKDLYVDDFRVDLLEPAPSK